MTPAKYRVQPDAHSSHALLIEEISRLRRAAARALMFISDGKPKEAQLALSLALTGEDK